MYTSSARNRSLNDYDKRKIITDWLDTLGGYDSWLNGTNRTFWDQAVVVDNDYIIVWQDSPLTDADKQIVVDRYERTVTKREFKAVAARMLGTLGGMNARGSGLSSTIRGLYWWYPRRVLRRPARRSRVRRPRTKDRSLWDA